MYSKVARGALDLSSVYNYRVHIFVKKCRVVVAID